MAIIRVANHSPVPFTGWKRCTVDLPLPYESCEVDGAKVIGASRIADHLRRVDVHVTLQPGENRTLDLSQAVDIDWQTGPLPSNISEHFGGLLRCNGEPMSFVRVGFDGAAYTAHMRCRTGRMLVVDLYLRYYPDQPSHAHAEAVVTCSNPSVPDLSETTDGVSITFGDSIAVLPGPAFGAVIPPGTRFVDGQAMAVPILFVWPRHVHNWGSVVADALQGIAAVGISRLHPDGNPMRTGDPQAWATRHLSEAVRRVRTWDEGVCGAARNSGQTGAQEDQMFVRGEALDFTGAELIAYLTALKGFHRPCHHLELDGSAVDPAAHPLLTYWSGRPHWHHGVSADRLGKTGNVPEDAEPSGGWLGPDRQHWLLNTVCAGARYTGSPALQQLLRHQAMLFLGQETIRPGWATSGTDVARSVGYAGLVVALLEDNLEDRDLYARVAERWRRRVFDVYLPNLDRGNGIWDPHEDERLTGDMTGYDQAAMGWANSFGAYGLALGCRTVGIPPGEQFALRSAKAVLDYFYTQEGDRWVEWDNVGWVAANPGVPLPASEMQEGKGAHRTGYFRAAWFPCAVATVLRYEPQHVKARAIWNQMLADTEGGDRSWMPPGVV